MILNIHNLIIKIKVNSKYIQNLLKSEFNAWISNEQEYNLLFIIKYSHDDCTIPQNCLLINTNEITYYYNNEIIYILDHTKKYYSVVDTLSNEVFIYYKHANSFTYGFIKSVLNSYIGYLLGNKDYFRMHGALVTKKRMAVILLGNSGSGKSTCAFHLMNAGYEFLSDDIFYIKNDDTLLYSYPNGLSIDNKYINENLTEMRIQIPNDYRKKHLIFNSKNMIDETREYIILNLQLSTYTYTTIVELTDYEKK